MSVAVTRAVAMTRMAVVVTVVTVIMVRHKWLSGYKFNG
jgi:hypothetical protein